MQDAVGVDVEGDFDLRQAPWCRWNAFRIEFAQQLVAADDFTLALVHLDGDNRLIVVGRRMQLAELSLVALRCASLK